MYLGTTLKQSEKELKRATTQMAEQRRITEAEVTAKAAAMDSADLQAKVITWAPRIVVGMAVLIGAYLYIRSRRKKNPRRRRRSRR